MMRLRPRPARRGDVPRGAADRPSCRRHVSALGPVQSCLNHPPRGSRMSVEMSSGSNRSALEVTAAVRTPTTQAHLDALRAPSALEGADHRLRRLGRQVDVAAFAARAQLQHAASLPAIVEGHSRWERYARTSPCADAKSLVAAWERCLAAAVAVADHLVEREPVRQPLRHVAWIHLVQGHPDPPRGLRREADGRQAMIVSTASHGMRRMTTSAHPTACASATAAGRRTTSRATTWASATAAATTGPPEGPAHLVSANRVEAGTSRPGRRVLPSRPVGRKRRYPLDGGRCLGTPRVISHETHRAPLLLHSDGFAWTVARTMMENHPAAVAPTCQTPAHHGEGDHSRPTLPLLGRSRT